MPASPSLSVPPVRPPPAAAQPQRPLPDEHRITPAQQAAEREYDSWRVALHFRQSRFLEILS